MESRAVSGTDDAGEEIVVTDLELSDDRHGEPRRPGCDAGADLVMALTNLIEGLAELPQFYGSATTQTPSVFHEYGRRQLNLRGLQSNRTLQFWMAGALSSRRFSVAPTSICSPRTCVASGS
jgi:hypothetical protein